LLTQLGYQVVVVKHEESGRASYPKAFLTAKAIANTNVGIFLVISSDTPLIGIEPSAILTFRDEYIRLWMIKKVPKD
jgi:Fe-S oxidoreductase